MKFTVKPAANTSRGQTYATQHNHQSLLREEAAGFVKTVAKTFHKNLLRELFAADLPIDITRQIAADITVEVSAPDALKVQIASPLAGDIEFGTRGQDETPWIKRAVIRTKREIAQTR